MKDKEKLLKEIKKLEKLVDYDELTELLNRRGFKKRLQSFFKEVKYNRNHPEKRKSAKILSLSLLFIDIDNFKKINDVFGHTTGDKVLKFISKKLEKG